ncbi:uncharacterized protein LOC126265274 [Aethina tumida]|uniref:uncharacterized protein LOC126265274 n=1 Tax=Aethina tumida TaxID=116153 RepID=UPI002148D8BD|nr:uncharacterized protein LOC126265274 [Aethina tumida]
MSNNDGPAPYKSVVRLSVDCLTRLAKGKIKENICDNENEKKEKKKKTDVPEECPEKVEPKECVFSDCEMSMMLKCYDEQHSINNAITVEDFEILLDRVEEETVKRYKPPCSQDRLIRCLQAHPNCSIQCRQYANEFIDCVDQERVIKIKKQIEKEKLEKMKEDEKELNNLLKLK